jgi:hypothetical protein
MTGKEQVMARVLDILRWDFLFFLFSETFSYTLLCPGLSLAIVP